MSTTHCFATRAVAILVVGLLGSVLHAQLADDQIFSRTFRVNPASGNLMTARAAFQFHPPMQGAINPDPSKPLTHQLQQLFAAEGIDLKVEDLTSSPGARGKAMFLSERTGVLFVRASLADLDQIETILQTINRSSPQVLVETKFAEIPADAHALPFTMATQSMTNVQILTEAQYRVALRALEEQGGVDLITPPTVTTISGRQARISFEATRTLLYDTPPKLPKDTSPDADPTPRNKGRLPFPPTFSRSGHGVHGGINIESE